MKTVIITGTTRGIGNALANIFIKNGYFVIGTAVTGVNLPDGPNFKGYDLDLSNRESIKNFIGIIKNDFGQIDILINNAGVCLDRFNEFVDMDKLRATFEVNLFGLIDLTENLLPIMKDGSQIFNMSSTASMLSKDLDLSRKYPSYKISKTALNMYTKTLGARLITKNTFVASIHPGWVKTDMGGGEADFTPEESANYIYEFISKKKDIKNTGLFWFKGEILPW